jgi:hypothetical protein
VVVEFRELPYWFRHCGKDAARNREQAKEGLTTMLRNTIHKAGWAMALLSLVSVTGCYGTFHEIVDPCYPERYNCKAREEVNDLRNAQVQNGLILEQTLFVHHFNPASETLNAGGVALLQRLANRRPAPENVFFIQTAQNNYDLDYKKPEEYASKRNELNDKRKVEVEKFLKMERPDVNFTVVVSNPARVGLSGAEGRAAVNNVRNTARGYFMIPGFQDTGGGGGGGQGGGN